MEARQGSLAQPRLRLASWRRGPRSGDIEHSKLAARRGGEGSGKCRSGRHETEPSARTGHAPWGCSQDASRWFLGTAAEAGVCKAMVPEACSVTAPAFQGILASRTESHRKHRQSMSHTEGRGREPRGGVWEGATRRGAGGTPRREQPPGGLERSGGLSSHRAGEGAGWQSDRLPRAGSFTQDPGAQEGKAAPRVLSLSFLLSRARTCFDLGETGPGLSGSWSRSRLGNTG